MNKVKELCIQKNIEQKELALLVGVSQPTVSDWFNNKKNPRGERLDKLSEVLGVPRSVILGYESEQPIQEPAHADPSAPTEQEDPLWREYCELRDQLTEEQQKQTLDYMRFLRSQKK